MIVYDSIEEGICTIFGSDVTPVRMAPVHGGDINESRKIELSNGRYVFAKLNTLENTGFFEAEEAGLNAIADTGAIGTPKLLFRGADIKRGISFLVMEFIDRAPVAFDFWVDFGRSLAQMHKADTALITGKTAFSENGKAFGFSADNYIGATQQINDWRDSWITFFRECRLEPQIKWADRYFDDSVRRKLGKLLDKLPEILIEPEKPALLHGDLWSGNYITGSDGRAWLIDPAVYIGHPEADIAMTELFGGFSGRFYGAYEEISPLAPGYSDRRNIYNLYHLLNHLNLFGGMYLMEVIETVERYV